MKKIPFIFLFLTCFCVQAAQLTLPRDVIEEILSQLILDNDIKSVQKVFISNKDLARTDLFEFLINKRSRILEKNDIASALILYIELAEILDPEVRNKILLALKNISKNKRFDLDLQNAIDSADFENIKRSFIALNKKLHDAIIENKPEEVKKLLTQGAYANAQDKNGLTPFLWAVLKGNTDIINTLLLSGADVNAQENARGYTALMVALKQKHKDVAHMLIKAKANVNIGNKENVTPLMYAIDNGFLDIVNELLLMGADVNAERREVKNTALMYAAAEGNLDIVKALLAAGADRYATNAEGYRAYDLARDDTIRSYIRVFEDQILVTLKSNDGQQFEIPLKVAEQSPVIKDLIDAQKDFNPDEAIIIPFSEISSDILASLVIHMEAQQIIKAQQLYKVPIRDFDHNKNYSQEFKDELYRVGIGFLQIPFIASFLANDLYEKYSSDKGMIENAIENIFPGDSVARGLIAKQYFLLFGDRNVNSTDRKFEFLKVNAPYGFNIQDLIDFDRIPELSGCRHDVLDLSNFKLNSVDGISNLLNIAKIRILNLQTNEIHSLGSNKLTDLQNLEQIRLNDNRLTRLDSGVFNGLSGLEQIDLSNNIISDIDRDVFQAIPNIRYLIWAENQLDERILDGIFYKLDKLQYLDLSDNKINSLEYNILNDLPNLKKLYLRNNMISEIADDTFTNDAKLESLDLGKNKLKSPLSSNIFASLIQLKKLDITDNLITPENIAEIQSELVNTKISS